ncbi:MAG: Fe-S cluster biogenesis protein NfuA, partial [Cognaticolwellia sp.]
EPVEEAEQAPELALVPEPEVAAAPIAEAVAEAVPEPIDFSAWTVKKLRAELESQGVELASRVRKAELIEMMEGLAEPTDDVQSGPALDPVVIQELLDDMVRPALQSDGGDISLIKVDGMDIHVRLVGACSTCPSSIMTMKMGVEALFREEFEGFGELIQVD